MIPQFLMMMMHWCLSAKSHAETNCLLCVFEISHLQNNTQCLHKEYPAKSRDQQFVPEENRHSGDDRTQRQTTVITHKNSSRIGIVPQKPNTSSHKTSHKNHQLSGSR